ncbi:MAG: hypothetical protein ACQEVA_02850 [Myxococcota bacterium]
MTEKNEKLFDTRVVERNIDKGLVTRKEYEEYLEGLDDVEDRAEVIEAEFEAGIFEDDDEEAEDAEEEDEDE